MDTVRDEGRPLAGLRAVVGWTVPRAAQACAARLRRLGADVVCVEPAVDSVWAHRLVDMMTRPGRDADLLVTDLPGQGPLAHTVLRKLRPGLVTVRVIDPRDDQTGWASGGPDLLRALGLTLDPRPGLGLEPPSDTGAIDPEASTGARAAHAALTAVEHRRRSGYGFEIFMVRTERPGPPVGADTVRHVPVALTTP